MPHQVQQLINKIRSEGIDQANANAQEIEAEAKMRAEKIITEAEKEAADIVMRAKMEAKKTQESGERALEQAARSMLLSLRKDIESILNDVITQEVGDALSSERIGSIIGEAVEQYIKNEKNDDGVHVVVSDETLKELGDGFMKKLQDKCKADLVFKASSDVDAGFLVSFDAGKTNFDFTDESLASFLGVYVNDQLSTILKRTVN